MSVNEGKPLGEETKSLQWDPSSMCRVGESREDVGRRDVAANGAIGGAYP